MSVEKKDTWPTNIKEASQIAVKKIEETYQDNNRSEDEDEDADKDADEDEDREEDPLEFEQHTNNATKSKALRTRPKAPEQQYEN